MAEDKIFYRRHLPHFQPPGAILFVTFRLYNSLPLPVIESLLQEAEALEKVFLNLPVPERRQEAYQAQKKMFAKWDAALDHEQQSERWLQRDEIAKVVADSMHYLDGKKYDLIAYCIMPNHVHIVFEPLLEKPERYYSLGSIMQSLKGYTAWKAHQILGRKGAFWQDESYDHVVRDNQELQRIIDYTLQNPVKAGLVESAEEWKWSYLKAL